MASQKDNQKNYPPQVYFSPPTTNQTPPIAHQQGQYQQPIFYPAQPQPHPYQQMPYPPTFFYPPSPQLQPADSSNAHIMQQILPQMMMAYQQQTPQQYGQHPHYFHPFPQHTPQQQPYQQRKQQQFKYKQTNQAKVMCVECDKIFDNDKMYQAHIQQHIKCPHCSFSASKRVVIQHQLSAHADIEGSSTANKPDISPNMIKWIKTMDTPEEIERWISERKRKYPSTLNTEREQASVVSQKEERKRFNEVVNTFRKKGDPSQSETSKRVHMESGEPSINYDGPEEDGPPEEQSAKVIPTERKRGICKFYLLGKCKHGTKCNHEHPHPSTITEEMRKKVLDGNKKKNENKKRKRGDLLEMLGGKEVRDEREVVYQAIRYLLSVKRANVVRAEVEVEEEVEEKEEDVEEMEESDVEDAESSNESDSSDQSSSASSEDDSDQEPLENEQENLE